MVVADVQAIAATDSKAVAYDATAVDARIEDSGLEGKRDDIAGMVRCPEVYGRGRGETISPVVRVDYGADR